MESSNNFVSTTRSEWRSVLLHLRIPFSYFLLPVFLFAVSQSYPAHFLNIILIFVSLHFFIYPASNAYNSYMDRDEKSIGILRHPPPVSRRLYLTSIFLDVAGSLLLFIVDYRLVLMILPYIGVSKAYSWHGIRLKKYSIVGWLAVILFQGGYTFMLVSMAAENNYSLGWFTPAKIECFTIATLLIGAYYPITQIYQHGEDLSRGDRTISAFLGVRGTLIFTALVFVLAFALAGHYFVTYYSLAHYLVFMISLVPGIIYFFRWMVQCFRDAAAADFDHTMKMTLISSTCTSIGFLLLIYAR